MRINSRLWSSLREPKAANAVVILFAMSFNECEPYFVNKSSTRSSPNSELRASSVSTMPSLSNANKSPASQATVADSLLHSGMSPVETAPFYGGSRAFFGSITEDGDMPGKRVLDQSCTRGSHSGDCGVHFRILHRRQNTVDSVEYHWKRMSLRELEPQCSFQISHENPGLDAMARYVG